MHIDAIGPVDEHDHVTFANALREHWAVRGEERTIEETKLNAIARFGEVAEGLLERAADGERVQAPAYGTLFDIGGEESSYPIRLAIARVIAAGGDKAYDGIFQAADGKTLADRLRDEIAERERTEEEHAQERAHRRLVMKAWLAPRLVGSCSERQSCARQVLEAWLGLVGEDAKSRGAKPLPLSLEIALAQGFKHVANRRAGHPQARADRSEYLFERARDMLRRTDYWYTRLTLVHALCLWTLPERDDPRAGRKPDLEALVAHWLETPAGVREHPFVVETCRLAARALETRQPERFIWIDESGVVRKVGSRREGVGTRRVQNLWIPPSTGWSTLDARAQQLVADVLILISLAERGDTPLDRDRRLERARRRDLPPCLRDDRRHLDPERTVGRVDRSPPGSNCKEGCPFDLCPYPPKGSVAYRVELSEAFCRRQQTLLRGGAVRGRTAPWQESLAKELRAFWAKMEDRART
jgi:hypothetical protein